MFTKVFFYNYKKKRIAILFTFICVISISFFYSGTYDYILPDAQHTLNTSEILKIIALTNKEERILNSDIFGNIAAETMIIVILLDRFSSGFEVVVSSLSKVIGIEEVLLVFSHSNYDVKLNSVIRSIDFCRVLQIYYPYSVQTHPKEFPGYGSSDCYGARSTYARNCSSLFSDKRGRFRNPSVAERKHHWWWTTNTVFETLALTANHKGLVVFSEDNFIFIKDFIYTTSYMKNVADSLPQCEFLSLGSDSIPEPRKLNSMEFFGMNLSTWSPEKHSRVLAFDMNVWDRIVSHYDIFCTLDDASWLYSLYYISMNRRDGKMFKAISAVTPRVFKVDSCNCKHWALYCACNVAENFERVTSFESANEDNMFPSFLELYMDVELEDDDVIFEFSKSDGGWADPRDWALCRNMTAGKLKQILMELRRNI